MSYRIMVILCSFRERFVFCVSEDIPAIHCVGRTKLGDKKRLKRLKRDEKKTGQIILESLLSKTCPS